MSNKFSDYYKEIEQEARAEGAEAVSELALFGERYQLAHQLMARRRALKLTQTELARTSGVGQAEISKIEGGRSNPTLETLEAVARALGCELNVAPVRATPS